MKTKPLLTISYFLMLLSANCNKQNDSGNSYAELIQENDSGNSYAELIQEKKPTLGKTPVASKNKNIDPLGDTPLHIAVLNGEKSTVQQLLNNKEKKIDINIQAQDGNTPLHHAACNGQTAIAKLLIEAGAALEIKNKQGSTPLWLAILHQHKDIVSLLLNKGADVYRKNNKNQNSFYCALSIGNIDVLKQILPKVKDINLIDPAQPTNSLTALNLATVMCQIDVVKLLIQQGAKINQKDKFGNTPLHMAALYNRTDIAKLLLTQKGINKNEKDNENKTPLAIAKEKGYTAISKLLEKKGGIKKSLEKIRKPFKRKKTAQTK